MRSAGGDPGSLGDQEMSPRAGSSSSPAAAAAASSSGVGVGASFNNASMLSADLTESLLGATMAGDTVKLPEAFKTWGDTLFPPLGKSVTFWAQGPIDVISWWLTLACLIAAMCKNPQDINGSDPRDVVIRCIEIGLATYFAIEWCLRAWFVGVGDGTAKYFRFLDLVFSAACGFLHIMFLAGVPGFEFNLELLVARSIRLFRPFVRITTMPAIRVFLTSMTRAVLRGASVIVLFVFFLSWFSAAGGYEFGGSLHARCISRAFFENSSAIQDLVERENLQVVDFTCGSAFFKSLASMTEVSNSFPQYWFGTPSSSSSPSQQYNSNTSTSLTILGGGGAFSSFGSVGNGYAALMNLSYSDTFFNTLSCSTSQTCVYPRDVPTYGGFICPFGYTCLQVGDNPYYGVVGFDNVFQAGLSLYVSNTFQIWYELQGWIADTGDPGAHWFFLFLILIGGFMIVNVTTVVLSIEFDQSMVEEKRNLVEQMSGLAASRAALQNVVRVMTDQQKKNKRKQVKAKSARDSAAAGGGGGGDDKGGGGGASGDSPASPSTGLMNIAEMLAAKKSGKHKHKQKAGTPSILDWQDDKAWQEADQANPVDRPKGGAGLLAYEEEMKGLSDHPASIGADFRPPPPPKMGCQEFLKKRIVKTKLFQLATGLVVFINCVTMALDSYGISAEQKKTYYNFDIFFVAFYVFEYLVRFSADGFRALKKASLNIDLLIVILSIVDLALADANFPGIRAFRVVRLVKLLKFFPNLYEWIIIVAVAIKSSPVLLIVMAVMQVTFACICMSLLGGRFCGLDHGDIHLASAWSADDEERDALSNNGTSLIRLGPDGECFGRPRANFDTLGDAIISSYQIATADDWDLIMFDAMRARGWWISLLFLSYFYVMTYLLLNQIIAVLLTANKQQEDITFESSGEDPLKRLQRLEAEQRAEEKRRKQEEAELREKAAEARLARRGSATGGDEEDDDEEGEEDEEDDDDAASQSNEKGGGGGGGGGSSSGGGAGSAGRRKSRRKKDEPRFLSRVVNCFFQMWDKSKDISRVICASHNFQWFMSVVIIVGSLSMAFETPGLAPDSTQVQVLIDLDIVITSLYVLELVLNVHAYGLIRRETSYLQRDPWNVMDAFLVLISVAGVFSTNIRGNAVIRVLRILRAVRPLRVVKRSPGMRLVLSSLISSATQMLNVFILSFVFFFTFAIVGMQFFSGYLRRCYIGDEMFEMLTVENCTALNGTYRMRPGEPNFDSIGTSFAALFLVSTLENWAELMYRMMDSPGPEMPPLRSSNPVAAPFFITCSFLLGFFISSFFVSVLIDAYNREKRHASLNKSLIVLREQEAWLMTAKRIARVLPHDDRNIKYDDDSIKATIDRKLLEFRVTARNFVESTMFQGAVNFLVLANFIMMCIISYPPPQYATIVEFLDDVFVFVWVAEAAIKIYALKWRSYVMSTWNKLDFVIAFLSLLSYILAPFFNRRALSLVRVVRVLRLLRVVRKYTKVTTLLRMMGRAFLALGHVLTFIVLIFFIFGVAGMNMFGLAAIEDRYANFRTLTTSLFLLLRITLGGNWIDLFMPCAAQKEPFCDEQINNCGLAAPVPQLYFFSFLFLSMFILKNLFTAVMLDAFTAGGNLRSIGSEDAKQFYEAWKKFDEEDSQMVHPFDTLPLLREIPTNEIIGFGNEPRRSRVGKEFKFLLALKMLDIHEPVSIEKFVDTLLSFSYQASMPEKAALAVVREGSAHIIDPRVIENAKASVRGAAADIAQLGRLLWRWSKAGYLQFKKAARVVCLDLAGIEITKEEQEQKKESEQQQQQHEHHGDKQDGDTDADGLAVTIGRRRSSLRAGPGGSLIDAAAVSAANGEADPKSEAFFDDEDLTDDELYARTASYVMINTLIMRKRQLMREQLLLNERIALRRFDAMGFRAIKKEGMDNLTRPSLASPSSAAAGAGLASPSSAAAAPSASQLHHSNSAHLGGGIDQQQHHLTTSASGGGGGFFSPTAGGAQTLAAGSGGATVYTQHHDSTWANPAGGGGGGGEGAPPGSSTPSSMREQLASRQRAGLNIDALRVSPGSPTASPRSGGGAASPVFMPVNHESTFFNSVCSYFASDERGVFVENESHNGPSFANGGDDGEGEEGPYGYSAASPRAITRDNAPSLLVNVLQLVDDLYGISHHTIKHDAFTHSVELARCFVELEWWSEAMCHAVRNLPDDHKGVDVAIALLPRNAGMQAMMDLHNDISEGIDRMREHHSMFMRSDARLEHDWFNMWIASDAKPWEEVCSRFPQVMQDKAESIWVPHLAKSLPTLELIGRMVPQLEPNTEVDPSVIFAAADNAVRRNGIWTSIAPPNLAEGRGEMTLTAHCDPEYASVFADAVLQASRMATAGAPRWKEVLQRISARAPTATTIAAYVLGPAKRHLQAMRSIYDSYLEDHKRLVKDTITELDRLASLRVRDLEENRVLMARQDHQVQQLRLCLQLLEQTYQDRSNDGEPVSGGLQFADDSNNNVDGSSAQHPKKSTVVAAMVHAILDAGDEREEQRSGAYDIAHAAELSHDCARKALHSLLENIPRDPDDDSLSAFVHSHHGGGFSLHDEEPIGSARFATECLTAVSRLAAAVAKEPHRALAPQQTREGANSSFRPDGESPDATTSRLQSVVSAATGPEFRSKLNLLVESGVTMYVLRAMPHQAERTMVGIADNKNVGISTLNSPGHTVSPPKRLYLRLSRTMDVFEMRQATGETSNVIARIPLGCVARIDGDTIGAAQAFGKSAQSAWPFLGTALANSRVMRFVVDTRRFAQRSGHGAAAPLSLMMPYGDGHDSALHTATHERSIVAALPSSIVYGEWLSLLRDVVRHRKLLPVLYAARADELREKQAEEDKLFKWKSAVRTTIATSRFSHAFGGARHTSGGGSAPDHEPPSAASAEHHHHHDEGMTTPVGRKQQEYGGGGGGGGSPLNFATAMSTSTFSSGGGGGTPSPVKHFTDSPVRGGGGVSMNNPAMKPSAAVSFDDI